MLITIAIPCFNSSKTLPMVVKEIKSAFEIHSEYDYQIILVNDGSPDNTFQIIRNLCAEDPKIIGIDLARNFGQASAKMAAVPHVRGDVLIYMDDDGQHDASGIFLLAKAVENGADMAIASFPHKHHGLFKRFTSWLNSEILRITIQKPKDLHTSPYAAYSKYLIERLKEYKSPFVSMFGYVLQNTKKVVNVELPHRDRLEGKSGYTLRKLLRLWSDGVFSFSMVPLRLAEGMSLFSFIIGFILIVASIVVACLGRSWGSLLVAGSVFGVGGILMLLIAILGEYIGRSYLMTSGTPQYAVRSILNEEAER